MPNRLVVAAVLLALLCGAALCRADEILFEDNFDKGLSEKWKPVGLTENDYRVRDGGLEIRVKPLGREGTPMLKVDLPFRTADTVIASVEVTVIGEPLRRGAAAGLVLTHSDQVKFSVRKTNIDGYFVFAPGEVDFIGMEGEEGDPANYTVKYWPAKVTEGPLRIIVRGHYAHAQVGPSDKAEYKTFFHSAITESKDGNGFGVMAVGDAGDAGQWVRFDNFRVTK